MSITRLGKKVNEFMFYFLSNHNSSWSEIERESDFDELVTIRRVLGQKIGCTNIQQKFSNDNLDPFFFGDGDRFFRYGMRYDTVKLVVTVQAVSRSTVRSFCTAKNW